MSGLLVLHLWLLLSPPAVIDYAVAVLPATYAPATPLELPLAAMPSVPSADGPSMQALHERRAVEGMPPSQSAAVLGALESRRPILWEARASVLLGVLDGVAVLSMLVAIVTRQGSDRSKRAGR